MSSATPRTGLIALSLCLLTAMGCDSGPPRASARAPAENRPPAQKALAAGQRAYAQTDFATAFVRFQEAAEQGDPNAQYYLGVMYADGQGTKRNFEEAARWYEKAAAQNHPDALYALARLYVFGLGVGVDAARALELYGRAAAAYPPGEQREQAEEQRRALAEVVKKNTNAAEQRSPQ